jgi:hypothetical protein
VIEVAPAESYVPERIKFAWSPSVYIGEPPEEGMSGPNFDTPNYALYAESRTWDRSSSDSLFPSNGLPNNVLEGSAWHTPPMGVGASVELNVSVDAQPVSRVQVSISYGRWSVVITDNTGEEILRETIINREPWLIFDRMFEFKRVEALQIRISNVEQSLRDLFVKNLYVGGRVTSENRTNWLALGGLKGSAERDNVVTGNAEGIMDGSSGWISVPSPDPTNKEYLYSTLGSIPRRVEALGMKTKTPGCIFRIAYSGDSITSPSDFEKISWSPVSGIYEMKNGRVKVKPFTGRQMRLEVTNLRPMLMKDFEGSIRDNE